ncbi:MAG: hypothetical protein JWN14_357, partial [Chthonomonadales bacterium]|nr:hypothetical protein [Chthonomonadales bacterium]
MNPEDQVISKARVARFLNGGTVRYLRTETSSVTTAWGVNWSEQLIARDVMQNFYDANRDRIGEIRVTADGQDVTISAPTEYNLQRLFYLGSEKGEEDVGHYGEGFKVAATCLLRDHRVTPVALSGSQALCLRIADEPVAGTQLFPLVYDFFELEQPCEGTRLILPGCAPKLVTALQEGLSHFFYPANPLLGERLWASPDRQFLIYRSQHTDGHVFYRNLLRGEIPRLPLILVIHKEFKAIEDKVRNDRDRNAFGDKLMDTFYKTFARNGIKGDREAVRILVQVGQGCWEQGHPLLSAVAESYGRHVSTLLDEKAAQALFGDRHFARSHIRYDTARQLRCAQMEGEWEHAGRIGLPAYFARFGVVSADRRCSELDALALKESQQRNSRLPTVAETACLQVVHGALVQLAPQVAQVFARQRTTYTVARTDVVLGELKRARNYRSLEVFLAERVFVADFAEALAVYLHEHAHVFGHDGDRGFTDALTELIEAAVRFRGDMDGYEAQWEATRMRVEAERQTKALASHEKPFSDRLASLS